MNNRIATLWVPGLINLTAAMSFLMLLRQLGLRPYVGWVGPMPMLLYVPWLMALPLFGGASAYSSRHAGARPFVCFTTGLFPAIVLFGLVCFGLLGMAIGDQLDRPHWLYITVSFVNWVVLPAVALMLGILSVVRMAKRTNAGKLDERTDGNHSHEARTDELH